MAEAISGSDGMRRAFLAARAVRLARGGLSIFPTSSPFSGNPTALMVAGNDHAEFMIGDADSIIAACMELLPEPANG